MQESQLIGRYSNKNDSLRKVPNARSCIKAERFLYVRAVQNTFQRTLKQHERRTRKNDANVTKHHPTR